MMHIAVCDRDGESRKALGAMARRYLASRQELHGRVCQFDTEEELLATEKRFSVCLLNAETEDSLEAGKRIKKSLPDTVLAFYSKKQDPAWAVEAYRLHAIQYLSVPVEEKALVETLDRAVCEGGIGAAQRIALNSTGGLVNLRISEIVYAKSSGHRITFFLRDREPLESKCLRVSFGTVIEPLLSSGFLRCHDSYAVNLSYAARLTAEGILLADGAVVPVSTKKRAWVREALKYCAL